MIPARFAAITRLPRITSIRREHSVFSVPPGGSIGSLHTLRLRTIAVHDAWQPEDFADYIAEV